MSSTSKSSFVGRAALAKLPNKPPTGSDSTAYGIGLSFKRSLGYALAALIATLLVAEVTSLDIWIQDHCFDAASGKWLVSGEASGPRLWFYDGPKVVVESIGVILAALLVGPKTWRGYFRDPALSRRELGVAFGCLVSIPLLISIGKSTTNIFCPWDIRRYGGDVPYVRVLECYPENDRPARRGRCFPAGHASGGFALIGLAQLARTRRNQWLAIIGATITGAWMGGYQMLRGAHYLSHTIISALLAWILFLVWRRLLLGRLSRGRSHSE